MYKAVQELTREIKPDHLLREESETLLCAIGREEWLIFEEDEDEEERPRNDGNAAAADDDSVVSNLISNIDLPTIQEDFL